MDITSPQLAGGNFPNITEDLVLGLTEDQNSQLEPEFGASTNTKNALILYASSSQDAIFDANGSGDPGAFTNTNTNVTLTTFGIYNGSYSIYESNDARLYVHDNISHDESGGST